MKMFLRVVLIGVSMAPAVFAQEHSRLTQYDGRALVCDKQAIHKRSRITDDSGDRSGPRPVRKDPRAGSAS